MMATDPSRSARRTALLYSLLFVVTALSALYWATLPSPLLWQQSNKVSSVQSVDMLTVPIPQVLLRTVYNASTDFINEAGVVPSYWSVIGKNESELKLASDIDRRTSSWGPCYPLRNLDVDWMAEINRTWSTNKTRYNRSNKDFSPGFVLGGCRPGFIIIGAGKCGTSSLYHYLAKHPRVLPAFAKQIHYFKYFPERPLSWYYSWFPTTKSFLSSGALMTGEASPGYLPYPYVAHMIKRRMPGPKILMIGRDPIDRSYSSYRYNYATPTIDWLQSGGVPGVEVNQPRGFYQKYLFSFEQLMKAELELLKECFAPGGYGENETYELYSRKPWAISEFRRRKAQNLTRLIDLDDVCYEERLESMSLPRQWIQLKADFPDKHIRLSNLHLTQALLGRSLYVFPLEWWYAEFDFEDIYFVCTEELHDMTGESLNQVGLHLGLPSFNFSSAVSKGAYNVGNNQGYDTPTPWQNVTTEANFEEGISNGRYPLSEELYAELMDFIHPINERLFALIGKRCDWAE